MKTVEIVAVYHSGDSRPNYVLGDAWDQATHYFTDYLFIERSKYHLPDGYSVCEDMSGAYHIYADDCSVWPCGIGRTKDGSPCIIDGMKSAKLEPIEVEA